MLDYPVTLDAQPEGGFVVTFVDIPEAITQGEDEDEALLNAVDALETALEMYVEQRRPLPVPYPAEGRPLVRPQALECAKLGIHQAMVVQGVKKAELARRTGWHIPQVNRLLSLRHASRMEHIETAARALGLTVRVSVG